MSDTDKPGQADGPAAAIPPAAVPPAAVPPAAVPPAAVPPAAVPPTAGPPTAVPPTAGPPTAGASKAGADQPLPKQRPEAKPPANTDPYFSREQIESGATLPGTDAAPLGIEAQIQQVGKQLPADRTILGHAPEKSPSAGYRAAPVTGPAPRLTPQPHPKPSKMPSAETHVDDFSKPAPSDAEVAPSPALEDELRPGVRIKQYELIRELGRGGMGSVFLARDSKLGRKVAIKFLHQKSEKITKRFLVEARATARCSHENIVVIHEVDEYMGLPYMVLEYLEGQPLNVLLRGNRKMTAARAVEIMVPVVRALVKAHEFGIVHRDLKPDNIFVCNSGMIKVLDFGIAKLFEPEDDDASPEERIEQVRESFNIKAAKLTGHGAILGTIYYMSPEQWGVADVDHRSDIWGVGLILYEMVTGENPLADKPPYILLNNAITLNDPMPSVAEKAPDLPGDLERIIDRCLSKKKEERHDDARQLLAALEPLLPARYGRALGEDESPYPGLTPFQERDANRFFGRRQEVARLATQIRERPLMAVTGPSGVGKSSLVRAGLVPALKAAGESWEVFITRPGRHPVASLAGLLQPLSRSSTVDLSARMEEQAQLTERLKTEPGYLGSMLRSRARGKSSSILLFVDQFEELYTIVPDAEERKAYTACLTGASDDASAPLRVVVSMRSDFLDRVGEDPVFMEELTRGLLFLQPPDRRALEEAITLPSDMAGYAFEDEAMVEEMLQNLQHTQAALPLLQFAASKLWEHRDRSRKLLTRKSYDTMGGIGGALATHADQVLAGLAPHRQKLVRAILLRLVTPDGTRSIVDVNDLSQLYSEPEEVTRVVDHLVSARLLTVQTRSEEEGPAVELVHESLVNSWPRLRRWLDESHEDAAFLAQLRTAAKQWEKKARSQGLLWRGEAMEEARRFHARYKGPLSTLEQEYLNEVFLLAARSARIRKAAIVSAFGFLLLLIAIGSVALILISRARKEAQRQAHKARIEATRAREAQQETIRQWKRADAEQKGRLRAQKEADKAKIEVATKDQKLKTTESKYNMTRKQLEEAFDQAKAERRKAERASLLATAAAKAARKAAAELARVVESERKLKKKYETLYQKEKNLRMQYQKRLKRIATGTL